MQPPAPPVTCTGRRQSSGHGRLIHGDLQPPQMHHREKPETIIDPSRLSQPTRKGLGAA